MRRLLRYAATLRHLRASQIAWRLRYALARRMPLRRVPPMPAAPPACDEAALGRLRAWALCRARHAPPFDIEGLRAGRLTFLHHTESASPMPPWQRADLPRLWRYHLHYFDCARGMACDPRADDADRARMCAWMHDWIDTQRPGADVAWDAFPTAQRIVNWCVFEACAGGGGPRVRASLAQQLAWLDGHLEFDLLGNHLLKDAAALAIGGTILRDAPRARRGLALLEAQVREQVLPDGGHYERSPMYHRHVLCDLLDVRAALDAPPAWLDAAIAGMLRFLAAVCHGDGGIPLFNDAARDPQSPARALVDAACAHFGIALDAPAPPCAFPDTGVYVLGDAEARLIVKAGAIGPDEQPGHAHADLLTFELSAGAQRLVVDGGTHGYAGSAWREFNRSVRAHNTLCVNGREPIDCWGVFRVGRRVRAVAEHWDGTSLRAHHDGYAPWRHTRTVTALRPGAWRIEDVVEGPRAADVHAWLHAPDGATIAREGAAWLLEAGGARLRVALDGWDAARTIEGTRAPMQGWYCPEFGVALPAPVLELHVRGPMPLHLTLTLELLPPG